MRLPSYNPGRLVFKGVLYNFTVFTAPYNRGRLVFATLRYVFSRNIFIRLDAVYSRYIEEKYAWVFLSAVVIVSRSTVYWGRIQPTVVVTGRYAYQHANM